MPPRQPNPYPGLRAFNKEQSAYFFGRDVQITDMLTRLSRLRFVCITGPSGCGKSSLARTGLFNALEAGFLREAGSNWVFCEMRPGANPLANLARTLAEAEWEVLGETRPGNKNQKPLSAKRRGGKRSVANQETLNDRTAVILRGLKASPKGAVQICRKLTGPKRSILLLVDQFEELFRFEQESRVGAIKFVENLLSATETKRNIYVALTVRTDQLENCANFAGLTEKVNIGIFLTPALTRFELQESIEGPAAVAGGSVDPELTNWLLNMLERESDRLPLMQHVMRVLWDYKRKKQRRNTTLTLADFKNRFSISEKTVKGKSPLKRAMSASLDEALEDAKREGLGSVVRDMFCALTDHESTRRDIRRPQRVDVLARVAKRHEAEIDAVFDLFGTRDRDFLSRRNNVIDVTHECVLRQWSTLQDTWVEKQKQDVELFRYLAVAAVDQKTGGGAYLRGRRLDDASTLFNINAPNEAWVKINIIRPNKAGTRDDPTDQLAGGESEYDESQADLEAAEKLQDVHKYVTASKQFAKGRLRRKQNLERAKIAAIFVCFGAVILFAAYQFYQVDLEEKEVVTDALTATVETAVLSAKREVSTETSGRAVFSGNDLKELKEIAQQTVSNASKSANKKSDQTGRPVLQEEGQKLGNKDGENDRSEREDVNAQQELSQMGTAFLNALGAEICPEIKKPLAFAPDPSATNSVCTIGYGIERPIAQFTNPVAAEILEDGLKKLNADDFLEARTLFLAAAKLETAVSRTYRHMGWTYLLAPGASNAAANKQAWSCFSVAVKMSCEIADGGDQLFHSLNNVAGFYANLAGDKKDTLRYAAVNAKIYNVLTGLTGTNDAPKTLQDELRNERRAAAAAGDAANVLQALGKCDAPERDQVICNQAQENYGRALSVWAKISEVDTATAAEKANASTERIEYEKAVAMGDFGIAWGRDPALRRRAGEMPVFSTTRVLSLLRDAFDVRKRPKYLEAYAVALCLGGQAKAAARAAEKLPVSKADYWAELKGKIDRCEAVDDPGVLFARPSE